MKISDIKIALARKRLQGYADLSAADSKRGKIAVLLEPGDENAVTTFRRFQEELDLQEGDLEIIICHKRGPKNDIFEQPFISLKDFSWNGAWSETSSAFLTANYDVLISFTSAKNKMADFLVSVMRARLKVGRKTQDKNGIFDLNISAELDKPEVFTVELKEYLKILKTTA